MGAGPAGVCQRRAVQHGQIVAQLHVPTGVECDARCVEPDVHCRVSVSSNPFLSYHPSLPFPLSTSTLLVRPVRPLVAFFLPLRPIGLGMPRLPVPGSCGRAPGKNVSRVLLVCAEPRVVPPRFCGSGTKWHENVRLAAYCNRCVQDA